MTKNRNELVKVQLNVYKQIRGYPGRYTDYFVAVVGPGIQLGNEDPNIAVRCNPVGRHFWTKQLWLPKDTDVYFKFLLVRASTNAIVGVEEIIPHRLYIGRKPLRVEMMYNKTTVLVEDADGDFQAIHKRKNRSFYIPSLYIQRSDKMHYKAQSDSQRKDTHSIKTETEATVPVDNIIDANSHEEKQMHVQKAKPELLQIEEIKPPTQYELTSQLDGTEPDLMKEEEATNPLTHITLTCPKQGVIQKEEKVTNPKTKLINTLTVEVIQTDKNMTTSLAQPTDSTTVGAIQKEQVSSPLTQSIGSSNAEVIQKEQVSNPLTMPTNSTTLEAVQKEQVSNPLTQSTNSITLEAVQKEQVANPLTQSTKCTTVEAIQKEQVFNPLTLSTNSTTVEAVQKKLKVTHPLIEHIDSTTVEAIQKVDTMTKPLSKSKMTSSENASLDISTVNTATVKPLTYQQQNVSSPSIDTPRNTGSTDIADDTKPGATKNCNGVEEAWGVKKTRSGHFPINKKGLMLVATGVAVASYLGYRAFR